jgi:hypothetical protein
MSLAVGREPHWLRLDEGAYLGFRRGPDTWIARFRDGTGEQNYNALKVPAHVRDEFVEAKRTALLANAAPRQPTSSTRARNSSSACRTERRRMNRLSAIPTASRGRVLRKSACSTRADAHAGAREGYKL